MAGTYGGIGVQIKRNEQGEIELYTLMTTAPALSAGIANGDVLLAINGIPLDPDTPQDTIDQMLRGEVKDGNGVQADRSDSARTARSSRCSSHLP